MHGAVESRIDSSYKRANSLLVTLIVFDTRARRRSDLNKGEPANPLGIQLEKPFDCAESLFDAFRVVESIDPDANSVIARKTVEVPHLLAAGIDGLLDQLFLRRPLDRYRIPLDCRGLLPVRHSEGFAIHSRFNEPVHSVDEIVAMELGMKAENTAAQQTVEQLLPPRADPERFRIWPRNVPERNDCRRRQHFADHSRHEGKMIVLNENNWIGPFALRDRSLRELPVHFLVLFPIGCPEGRANVSDVAQRPEPFVREPVVVPGLLLA